MAVSSRTWTFSRGSSSRMRKLAGSPSARLPNRKPSSGVEADVRFRRGDTVLGDQTDSTLLDQDVDHRRVLAPRRALSSSRTLRIRILSVPSAWACQRTAGPNNGQQENHTESELIPFN